MDNYDMKILQALHQNARITMKELSQKVHLSQPACTERVKKMEANGIIRQYTAVIDWSKLSYPLATVVRIRPLPGYLQEVERIIKEMGNIAWCVKVTGDDAFICQMLIHSVSELDACLSKIAQIATTNTSVIKSTVVENQFIQSN
ncbi:Lrp/AsnC family transcriptional regulator [Neisseria sp. ZJ106]|uniref:Lrp/AsnC family transcriptional regulator n=1 Tax=Neisseria lisongii TaxID=2912188 RepID=A0AAW5AKG8_9NEIS|nr:Lrp/AsnC family transcriptional regulator [Neisseria lisongii]MCF7520937.1 Lrp/AsnC family transcriptional regulator [Neisseria lisongii]MCF7528966.1 Lrp/AsnC family transcriptional regulator [Neisseria lisongii]WCL71260.1 Lrp/AsnC family transcriptional regulator [Neisseria lisongii]